MWKIFWECKAITKVTMATMSGKNVVIFLIKPIILWLLRQTKWSKITSPTSRVYSHNNLRAAFGTVKISLSSNPLDIFNDNIYYI